MHKFEDLIVWKKSMELATELYKVTTHFPREEQYGLTSQIRKCAVSMPSNISEGSWKKFSSTVYTLPGDC